MLNVLPCQQESPFLTLFLRHDSTNVTPWTHARSEETTSNLKVHYATFLRAVNKQKSKQKSVLDARNSSFAGANMTFRCTLKPRVYICIC